jgi:hypothetical protein
VFDLDSIGMINVPQYAADPYRAISISKIPPEIKPIVETWEEVPYPYVAKHIGLNYWSKNWPTRHDARVRVEKKQVWNCALAHRSAIICSLEPGVDAEELPDKWPTIVQGERKYTFGMCEFPTHESKHLTHIQASPMCSPATFGPEFVVDAVAEAEVVNVAMAAHYDHTDAPEIKIQLRDNPDDAPSEVQNSATARDVPKTMVWAGCVTTRAVPTHLRGTSDRCLVYRWIIKDCDDNNKILDDTFAILYTPEHLARKLCEEPHKLEIAIFDCGHPQYIATDLTDVPRRVPAYR